MSTLLRVAFLLTALVGFRPASAESGVYSFNVLNHRSVALTAQYWNPILLYVRDKTGITLELKLTRTAQEHTATAETGVYDFLYTNHFFTPEREKLGYRVIARSAGPGIRGQIIVNPDSPIRDIRELEGKEVVFPTPDGFTGYWVPMDALVNAGVTVKRVFSGNQELSMGRVRNEEVAAAAVNSAVLENFARRTGYNYRVLWSSAAYYDLCIMAHPRVPKEKVAAVRAALVGMAKDPQGRKILAAGAELLKTGEPAGFVVADNRDYESYRAFYRHTRVK